MRLLYRPLTAAGLIAALAACQTPPVSRTQDSPLKAARREGYFVVARFMDEGTLRERYGARLNPFIAVSHALTPRRFVVFKLNVEEVRQPLRLQLRQMVFTLGNKTASPMTLSRMKDYWALEDPDTGIAGAEVDIRDRALREDFMPDEVSLPSGSRLSKLVLFSENFPTQGEARLNIPMFDQSGRLLEQLEFAFIF